MEDRATFTSNMDGIPGAPRDLGDYLRMKPDHARKAVNPWSGTYGLRIENAAFSGMFAERRVMVTGLRVY